MRGSSNSFTMRALSSVEQSSQTISSQSAKVCARTEAMASRSVVAPFHTFIMTLTEGILVSRRGQYSGAGWRADRRGSVRNSWCGKNATTRQPKTITEISANRQRCINFAKSRLENWPEKGDFDLKLAG